ncbi:hypothetical protein MLD38_016128 [Melastoma candidum]|uniref:Uncharacterized protein n=1 Tax=Melastoma candidum TaxID=119954 RepID=A0ACB9RIK3_9MYRT|nr:hypothetical protein MLD38_016128 [Melastoma candidum]
MVMVHFLLLLLPVALSQLVGTSSDLQPQLVLSKGFSASPSSRFDPFLSLLTDPLGNFSLGFLRVDRTGLSLVVLHAPSSLPVWTTCQGPGSLSPWSGRTELRFNGSLVLSDSSSGEVYWSAGAIGDRVVLLSNSNLQIQRLAKNGKTVGSFDVVWQSFGFPSDTLVEGQSFSHDMSLTSTGGQYSMRLGTDFIGLYANFGGGEAYGQMYWKHKALEVKAEIMADGGPIFVRVEQDGYLAMYQNGTVPVDVEPFSTFHRSISTFHLLRLEPDGNLKAYYWTGTSWNVDYQAINEFCELPSPCGPYGLCKPGEEGCSCLDNHTDHSSGPCTGPISTDLCTSSSRFSVLRRKCIELPYKELMAYQTALSPEECEHACESNCSCWGTVYNNVSKFCYPLHYPVQTLLSVGDENKLGYFKMVATDPHHKESRRTGFKGAHVLTQVLAGIATAGMITGYRAWSQRKGRGRKWYKDIGSDSLGSMEFELTGTS